MSPSSPSPPSAPHRRRILVVDDHPLLREGVIQFINRQTDLVCCGEADTVSGALAAALAQKPDLILLDLRLDGSDALELIKSLKAQLPEVTILILSQYDDPIYAERALRAGALGYVVKEDATEEVLGAIRAALTGEMYVSRKLANRVLSQWIKQKPEKDGASLASLTDRELEVFRQLGSGLGTKAIAGKLNLSPKTIETHRENIKHKLGIANAAALVENAERWVRSQSQ